MFWEELAMWQMPEGVRVLLPNEREIMCFGLYELLEIIEDAHKQGEPFECGLESFDTLTYEQKLFVLAETTQALTNPAIPPPRLTAANEAAIAAIFFMLEIPLQAELEEDDSSAQEIRALLLKAAAESKDPLEEVPSVSCPDLEEWRIVLRILEERILWDMDFASGDAFLDAAPEGRQQRLEQFGIDPEYFLTVVPEPTVRQLKTAREQIVQVFAQK
jgi:hypothetical protein